MAVGKEKKKNKNVEGSADHQNFQGHTATNSLNPGAKPSPLKLPYRIVMKLVAGEYADHLMQACASRCPYQLWCE